MSSVRHDLDYDYDLTGLHHGWDYTGRHANICAACGQPIRQDHGDDEDGEVPLQLFLRKSPQRVAMLSFHWACGLQRLRPAETQSGAE